MPTAPRAPTAPRCLNDVVRYPALEWLSLRRDGQSCAYIAHRAGVSEEAVNRATKAYGPSPTEQATRPHHTQRRGALRDGSVVGLRSVALVAPSPPSPPMRAWLTSTSAGPRATMAPTRRRETVEEWVEARRAGKTSRQIATEKESRWVWSRARPARTAPSEGQGIRCPKGSWVLAPSLARSGSVRSPSCGGSGRVGSGARLRHRKGPSARGCRARSSLAGGGRALSSATSVGLAASRSRGMSRWCIDRGGRERAPGRPAAREQTIPSE